MTTILRSIEGTYYITSIGQAFIIDPSTVISVDPHSRVIGMLLGVVSSHEHASTHKRGTQLKPHIISAMEGPWIAGGIKSLAFLSSSTDSNAFFIKLMYFNDCFFFIHRHQRPSLFIAIHSILPFQIATQEMSFCLSGEQTTLMLNRSYCSGVKVMWGREMSICCIN